MKKYCSIIIALLLVCFASTAYADLAEDAVDGLFDSPIPIQRRFSDVPSDLPAKTAIDYLYMYSIVSGGYDDKFYPEDSITREQFVKVLILAFGLYDSNAASSFYDSTIDDWHYPYISSARKAGLVNGVSESVFGVGMNIERQEMLAMVYRVASYIEYSFGEEIPQAEFSDLADVDEYAAEAVDAMALIGVLPFGEDGALLPKQHATRAEVCMLIYNMIKNT